MSLMTFISTAVIAVFHIKNIFIQDLVDILQRSVELLDYRINKRESKINSFKIINVNEFN